MSTKYKFVDKQGIYFTTSTEPWHWKYSSAKAYMTKEKRLLDLVFLE